MANDMQILVETVMQTYANCILNINIGKAFELKVFYGLEWTIKRAFEKQMNCFRADCVNIHVIIIC